MVLWGWEEQDTHGNDELEGLGKEMRNSYILNGNVLEKE